MKDLIFVSMEDWDEVWRRNQFLCTTLARRFPKMKILFVGLPRNMSNRVRRMDFKGAAAPATWTVPDFPNITVTSVLKLVPDSFDLSLRFNEAMARRHIIGEARRLGLKSPLLWLNPCSALHMAGRMGESGVIYDITDDWALMPSFTERERETINRQDRALCGRADLVIACSHSLQSSRRPISRRVLLLQNGVDAAHYAQSANLPAAGRRWPQPVFGYTGTIHPDRVDFTIVKELARSFPEGSVVLVGFDHSQRAQALLGKEPNVHLPGQMPYARIPEFMAEFDVCIVPHVETTFTNSLNPIKLWEYLACGKPIVSTDVAGFRDYSQHSRVASGAGPFVAACREALSENDESLPNARREEAGKHSWEARVDVLLDELKSLDLVSS